MRQDRQDLAVTAGPAQQVPDRQAGHPGGHRELGARVSGARAAASARAASP